MYKINVGGTIFFASKETLCNMEFFKSMIERWHISKEIIIDREPEYFALILKYLRNYELDSDKIDYINFKKDCEFYQVNVLPKKELVTKKIVFKNDDTIWEKTIYLNNFSSIRSVNIHIQENEYRHNSNKLFYNISTILKNSYLKFDQKVDLFVDLDNLILKNNYPGINMRFYTDCIMKNYKFECYDFCEISVPKKNFYDFKEKIKNNFKFYDQMIIKLDKPVNYETFRVEIEYAVLE